MKKVPNQIFDENDLVGKTIRSTDYDDDRYYIAFTDNTFVTLEANAYLNYGETEASISISQTERDYIDYSLKTIGIITTEEYDKAFQEKLKLENKLQEDQAKAHKKYIEKQELAQLEALRKKYGQK